VSDVRLNELAEVTDMNGNPIYVLVPVDDAASRVEVYAPLGGKFDEAGVRRLISKLHSASQLLGALR
jgi:hypothetical protein